MFHRISKHLEFRQKYCTARRIFNSLLGVWKCDEILPVSRGFGIFVHASVLEYWSVLGKFMIETAREILDPSCILLYKLNQDIIFSVITSATSPHLKLCNTN